MADLPSFEIPQAVRDIAEKNVEQARSAYQKFADMAKQAQDTVAKSQGVLTMGTQELQTKAMAFAQANIDENFAFAAALARARSLTEYAEIQTKFAQKQMQTYTTQAQELGRLMAEAAQKGKL